ncbi:hypothetical protein [Niastella populi]|uniref:ZU5 domain-containing protein n=1 Tax=Niastella populi TaxID=550983 RepID=A0A1V9FKV4_9BACT|nr:hypothetical protein [Niastella populi]OQP59009.1 hypothetical protein A4R26_21710 [Niastella populi]
MLQRITAAITGCALMFLLFACKKDNNAQPDPVYNGEGVATPVGLPDATAASVKTIGAEGGAISSADGRIKLSIPAGAVSAAQQFTVQSISNQNPLAIGKAYRLMPHNVTFSKPVTIEFSYNEEEIINTLPEALGIAYQDDKGIWQAQGSTVIDPENKKARVTTTHFSDWSLFESFYLVSSASMLPVNGTADLEVFCTEDILAPLTPGSQVPMGKKISIATTNIKEWKLAGAGNLQANGAKAVYKAPGTVPNAPNPVAISVNLDLKQRGKFMLVKNIEITGDDGEIEVRVAGGNWVKQPASPAVKMGPDNIAMADSDGDARGWYVLIRFVGGVGTHAFKDPAVIWGTHVHYHITGGNNYTCAYINGAEEFVPSGGGVTITSMGDDDGFIKGTFVMSPAGFGNNLKNTTTVEGRFRVRKSW